LKNFHTSQNEKEGASNTLQFDTPSFVVLYGPAGEAVQVFHAVYLIIFILFFSPY